MAAPIFLFGDARNFENYDSAIAAAGGALRFSADPADAAGCAGLLLPGGGDLDPALYGAVPNGSDPPDPVRDAAELRLADEFFRAGLPILGICRGMQVLNVFFGGTLVQELPGHSRLNGADRLHFVRAAVNSLPFRLYGARFTVNSAHHQAVERPGRDLRIVCHAGDGTPEALEHVSAPILAVQWHPERLTGGLARPGAADGGSLLAWFTARCERGESAADGAQNWKNR